MAGAGGHLAVERHRRLEDHERPARARVLAEGLVEHARGLADLAVHEVDPHALVAQDARAAAGGLGGRVVGGDHHAGDAGGHDRVGARRRAAVMAAGLQRHVHGRARRVARGLLERHHLGVALARRLGDPLPDHAPVLDHDGTDHGVRAGLPARASSKFDGPQKVLCVALRRGGVRHPENTVPAVSFGPDRLGGD
jgi:hypothetical protein